MIRVINTGYGYRGLNPGTACRRKVENPEFAEDWIRVAEMDRKILSTACSKPDVGFSRRHNARRADVGPVATLPDYSWKGLAEALMCRTLNFLIDKKMDVASLGVAGHNKAAVGLYKKLGFLVTHNRMFLR